MGTDYTHKPWTKMSLEKLKTPRNGTICYLNSWWCITLDRCVLFYRGSPQCNSNEACAESIRQRIHPDCTIEKVDVTYLPHNYHDYTFERRQR